MTTKNTKNINHFQIILFLKKKKITEKKKIQNKSWSSIPNTKLDSKKIKANKNKKLQISTHTTSEKRKKKKRNTC